MEYLDSSNLSGKPTAIVCICDDLKWEPTEFVSDFESSHVCFIDSTSKSEGHLGFDRWELDGSCREETNAGCWKMLEESD